MSSTHSTVVPIEHELPAIRSALSRADRLILSAPPGAGKTTRVPLALVSEAWCHKKKIVMLEPRRLAARRAAEYMASLLGERAGETVGYAVRGERKISHATQIEVVTEGILTRMLQTDPALEDTACIIFDEFHERSIHADVGLALALDVQTHLRNDLKIVVMSATLDVGSISSLLGDRAVVIRSEGKSYPVETRYMRFASTKMKDVLTADAIQSIIQEEEHEGDMLVFLPGRREIRFVETLLYERRLPEHVRVHTLYGEASAESQQAALQPARAHERKVILSTSIAETSLTIDGVRIVVDSGRTRTSQFDPRRGMSGLVTVPVSKAAADQRRGRAGRQAPGFCMRLWTESEHELLPEYSLPEIKTADLAPLALDLAAWGEPTGEHLCFIDPPPAQHLSQARSLLETLGALDARTHMITEHGRKMSILPVHPRLAHMIVRGHELGCGDLACTIAALLEERDLFAGRSDSDIDLSRRIDALEHADKRMQFSVDRITNEARRLRSLLSTLSSSATSSSSPARQSRQKQPARTQESTEGLLLALAYPDRIARRRDKADAARYLTSNGTTAVLPKGSLLGREEFLAIGETDLASGSGDAARILLAAPITQEDIEREIGGDAITREEEITWNAAEGAVTSRRLTRLGAVILSERPVTGSDTAVVQAMIDGIRSSGIGVLPWTKESESLCARSEWARLNLAEASGIVPMDRETLLGSMEEWLAMFLHNIRRLSQLSSLDLPMILSARLGYETVRMLDSLAPAHLLLPSGSRIAIDYTTHPPVLAVRLQELFGQTETPVIGRGRTMLLLHILSPAHRPLAVTQDLNSFWRTLYPELRTQMRARYPKHVWPDDPLSARPTNKTKRHQTP